MHRRSHNAARRLRRIGAVLSIVMTPLIILAACGGSQTNATAAGTTAAGAGGSPAAMPLAGQLTVFAAASLTESFNELQTALMATNPDLKIAFNFAGSQQLVTQLTQGAEADVFASANSTQMQAAQDGGVIAGDPRVFTRNRLVIIVPKDNPAGIAGPGDLAKPGVKLVVGVPDVPVGKYSLQVLDKLAQDPQFGSAFGAKARGNIVSQETDVKQVVAKVQLGEADAGVVYVTDVTPDVAPNVRMILIPDQYNVIAEYPIAAVQGGNAQLAQAFIAYLLSPDGQAILQRHGFAATGP